MKRSIADEIDPPPKRGRPSKRAERNAAAVDLLFSNCECAQGTSLAIWTGEGYAPVKGVSDLDMAHGWPQEPVG